jgi:hypothetical protein
MTSERTRTAGGACRPEDTVCKPVRPLREPGSAPEGEPGNVWAWPEAERPPLRREGTVSDPDRYGREPTPAVPAEAPYPRVGTVSNPDF